MNPKWVALSEVLDEIQKELSESKSLEKCLVVTQDDRTSQQLRDVSILKTINVLPFISCLINEHFVHAFIFCSNTLYWISFVVHGVWFSNCSSATFLPNSWTEAEFSST